MVQTFSSFMCFGSAPAWCALKQAGKKCEVYLNDARHRKVCSS